MELSGAGTVMCVGDCHGKLERPIRQISVRQAEGFVGGERERLDRGAVAEINRACPCVFARVGKAPVDAEDHAVILERVEIQADQRLHVGDSDQVGARERAGTCGNNHLERIDTRAGIGVCAQDLLNPIGHVD